MDPFRSSWNSTVELLKSEVDHLGAHEIVIQLALSEAEIRLDGMPRANSYPTHPGVIISFESRHGPLSYHTDRFANWQGNVRAIALSLEALRKVDRYGVAGAGEQYTGWRAIGSGIPMGAGAVMSEADALAFLREHSGRPVHSRSAPFEIVEAYKQAAKVLHPDAGGDVEEFKRLQEARRLLLGEAA